MKQFYLLFIAIVLCPTCVNAQFVMSNHAPVPGEMHQRYQCDSTNINPGASGANKLWNFSIATRSSVIHSYTAAPSQFFSPATVVVESDRGYEDHYHVLPSSMQDYSSSFPIVSGYYINLNYDQPSMKAWYPLTLHSTGSKSTGGNINAIMISPQAGTFKGTSTTHCDATGTLVLPGATYTNVVRVVNTETLAYTVNFPGTISMKNYDFYMDGIKHPVFSIATVTLTRPSATITRTLVTRLKHAAPAAPQDVTPESSRIVCENGTASLTARGAGTIEWFETPTSTEIMGTDSTYVISDLPIGEYTLYARSNHFMTGPRTAITFTVTDCTSVGENSEARSVTVYPNPSEGAISLDIRSNISRLQVYRADGVKTCELEAHRGMNVIDLKGQPDGIYFIRLISDNAVTGVKKIVIRHR